MDRNKIHTIAKVTKLPDETFSVKEVGLALAAGPAHHEDSVCAELSAEDAGLVSL